MMILELALALAALQPSQDAAVNAQLEGIEQRLAATWQKGECSAWGAMIAPEWSVIHITGDVITRAEVLEMCNAPRTGTETFEVGDLFIRLFGDAAVVTGRTTVTVRGPNPGTLTLRFTDVFIRREGRWQVVASHATRLGGAP